MRIKSVFYFSLALPLLSGFIAIKHSPDSDPGKAVLVPTSFINGERLYIKMPSVKGDTLLGFCDTGGGLCFTFPPTIDKLALKPMVKTGHIKGLFKMKFIDCKDIVTLGNIPTPIERPDFALKYHSKKIGEPYFVVLPMDGEMKFFIQTMPIDVFLGQNYFMGKSWTIDYIHHQLWTNTPLAADDASVQKIGFKKNAQGLAIVGHPCTFIEVDGEQIDVLFDTGATIILSDSGKKVLNTAAKTIGGSFIAKSVFEKWRQAHPYWKIYTKADRNADIIEVPKVKIGKYDVGPVLFAERPDEAWSKYMIGSMDKVVKGAIGGSGLKYLKVTIDYNSELIKFEK